MQFNPKTEESTFVNLTPLIDVVFLLLIFFMVSSELTDHSPLDIVLPKVEQTATQTAEQNYITLTILPDGRYQFDSQTPVQNKETLQKQLKQMAKQHTKPSLIIQADAHTPHHAVVTAIAIADKIGFTGLRIRAETPNNE